MIVSSLLPTGHEATTETCAAERSTGSYVLRGLIFCAACARPLHPVLLAATQRAYRSLCGCRLGPVDAGVIERLVQDAAEQETQALFAGVPAGRRFGLVRQLVAEVRVGGTVDDLAVVWRT